MEQWTEVRRIDDEAEHVAKYIFSKSNAVAEAVLYRYPTYRERTVICCSTQSGCPVGCRFCGAGDHFVRSFTADEIIAQPARLLADVDCDPADMGRLQIMFMSMGEPLLNLKGLVPALHRLYEAYPNAALLISTSAPAVDYDPIIQVSKEIPTIGLQFSVHESTDEARDKLIPFKAKLSLAEIAARGVEWFEAVGRQPFFNYCAHDDNVFDSDVDRVTALFDPEIWCATVSVICERGEYLTARNDHQRALAENFGDALLGKGFDVRVFDPAGQDTIGGGCGQLWFVQDWMRANPDKTRSTAGTDKPIVHAPV